MNIPHIFSIRHRIAYLCIGTLDSTSALYHFKSPTRRTKMQENVALSRPGKGCVFTVGELNQEGRTLALFDLSWERVSRPTQFFTHISMNDFRSATKIAFRAANKF